MDDFVKRHGMGFFVHILWRLRDHIMRAYEEWGPEIGYLAPPRTHSTLLAVHEAGSISVTEIASTIRTSHPLVITWIRQLKEAGLVVSASDPEDARRTLITLTPLGRDEIERQKAARVLITRAFERLMTEADAPVYEPLWRIEAALRREPFIDRLRKEERNSSSAGRDRRS